LGFEVSYPLAYKDGTYVMFRNVGY
jgi:hypothetical protein